MYFTCLQSFGKVNMVFYLKIQAHRFRLIDKIFFHIFRRTWPMQRWCSRRFVLVNLSHVFTAIQHSFLVMFSCSRLAYFYTVNTRRWSNALQPLSGRKWIVLPFQW